MRNYEEEDFEDVLPTTNKEDRVNRIQPELSCGICPPNRGENAKRDNWNLAKRRPKQKTRSKSLREAQKFKRAQKRVEVVEHEDEES